MNTPTFSPLARAIKGLMPVSLLLLAPAVLAEQIEQEPIETLVVTASALKVNTPMAESPVSVSVVSEDDLEFRQIDKLDEAFRYNAGVVSSPYGADNDTDWLLVRGFEAATYLDGSRLFKDGYYVWMLETYGLEQVELLKGPASILYGEAPPGGVVNAVQKKPTYEEHSEVSLQVGNKNSYRGTFDFARNISDDKRFRLVGVYNKADGELDDSEGERFYIAPSFAVDLSEDTTLTVLGSVTHDDNTPTNPFFTPYGTRLDEGKGTIDPETNYGDPDHDVSKRTQVSLGYQLEHRLDDTWDFTQKFNYGYNDLELHSTYIKSEPAWLPDDSGTWVPTDKHYRGLTYREGDLTSFTFDNQLVGNWFTNRTEQTLLVGVDLQSHSNDGKEYDNFGYGDPIDPYNYQPGEYVPIPEDEIVDREIDKKQASIYAQYQLKLDEQWIGIVGGRYDYVDTENKASGNSYQANLTNSRTDNEFSFNAGLMYITEFGVTPYISYTESFEVLSTVDQITGELYDPLDGKQTEIGFKYQPDFIDGYVNLAWYKLEQDNALVANNVWDANYGWLFGNTQNGKATTTGVELEAVIQATDKLKVTTAYTYADATVEDTGASGNIEEHRAAMIPEHQASLYLDFQATDKLRIGSGVRYVGTSYDAYDAYQSTLTPDVIKVPAYTIWDASVSYDISSQLQAKLNVNNLLDEEYVSACNFYCYYGESRSVMASINYSW